ncbi:hypothetical protein ACEPAF_6851 [Sanghuangporus sanghuang]
MAARRLLVDVHTHVYLPLYANVLRSRSNVPRIVQRNAEERLVILENEPSEGRPVGPQYWDRKEKLAFMDKHGIDLSIVSSANPWLDFLSPAEAEPLANDLNDDLEAYCASSPTLTGTSLRRLYGFGLLPLVPDIAPSSILKTISQVASLPHLRGVVLGTRGIGHGLDDETLEPVWEALASTGLVVFLHPHYGLGAGAPGAFGERENGHVLPLALGFPMETTAAITRLILAGVLDRHPNLRILLAHSGGALPALSSRLASCISHDPIVSTRLAHDARYYLGKLYYDAVAYGAEELGFVSDSVSRAEAYSDINSSARNSASRVDRSEGSQRILFGTDHPFFPPLSSTEKWKSVVENLEAIDGVQGWDETDKDGTLSARSDFLVRDGHLDSLARAQPVTISNVHVYYHHGGRALITPVKARCFRTHALDTKLVITVIRTAFGVYGQGACACCSGFTVVTFAMVLSLLCSIFIILGDLAWQWPVQPYSTEFSALFNVSLIMLKLDAHKAF